MIAGMTEDLYADVVDEDLVRPDGRTVAWTRTGSGTPLLRLPGTPGSRWSIRADRSAWTDRGLQVITTERAGYGRSSRLPGRRFREHSDDLAAITTSLTWWHGAADRNCPIAAARRLVDKLPTATLRELGDAGHFEPYRRLTAHGSKR
jgi:pimeloyl-ACP methyl ester carboxylesterase